MCFLKVLAAAWITVFHCLTVGHAIKPSVRSDIVMVQSSLLHNHLSRAWMVAGQQAFRACGSGLCNKLLF